jgi:hypothetical protein
MSLEGLRFAAVVVPLAALALAWAEWPSLRQEWSRARTPDPAPDANRHG